MRPLLLALLGCPAPPTPIDPGPPGCALCAPDTVCVQHLALDDALVDTTCAPFPADCGTNALNCDDNTCREALHAHCDPGFDPASCRPTELLCREDDGT
jgi:hypothetical protein